MADYFNHGIAPLQKHFDLKSQDLFHSLGQMLGQNVAQKYNDFDLRETLQDLSRLWEELRIGRLVIEGENPLELVIYDCTICGRLPGSGGMYDCAFHEGFFESVISARLDRKVGLKQVTNFEGNAGTWCRRYISDTRL